MSEVLAQAPVMSAANWCEVLQVTGRRGDEATHYLSLVEILPLTVEHCRASARYSVPGLSLGDRCCLALADVLSLPVLTADRAWEHVAGPAEVRMIR